MPPASPTSPLAAPTPPVSSSGPKQILAGIALILGAGFVFTIMDASAKYLAGRMPVAEIAWGRYLFATLALPIMLHRYGGLSTIRSRRLGLQLLRSFFLLCFLKRRISALSSFGLPIDAANCQSRPST